MSDAEGLLQYHHYLSMAEDAMSRADDSWDIPSYAVAQIELALGWLHKAKDTIEGEAKPLGHRWPPMK